MMGDESSQVPSSNRVAIIGCGKLGRRIALAWLLGGFSVRLYDTQLASAAEALNWAQVTLEDSTFKSKENMGHVEIASNLPEAVQRAWMVIESVPEQIHLKTYVLGEVDKLAHPMTIIATNSSSIRSSKLVSKMSDERKIRFLNTHYYRPPEQKIAELMTCGRTSAAVIREVATRMESIGLEPMIVGRESTGFVGNRIWAAIKRETMSILAEGVSSAGDIDRVFKANLRAAWGPCELMDQVGLQTVCAIEDVYIRERNLSTFSVDFIRQEYVDRGHLGQDTGRGLMRHPLESPSASIRDQLLGSWELMEWAVMDTEGHKQKLFGGNAQGRLLYNADGYISATLQIPGQEPFGEQDPRAATEGELAEASRRFISYTGTFSTEDDPCAVIHRVECCNFPRYRGQAMRRFVKLETAACDRMLTLTCDEVSPNLEGGRDTLRWRKASRQGSS